MVDEELLNQQPDTIDSLSDQSDFAASQTVLQAPPILSKELSDKDKKRRLTLIVSLVAIVLLVVIMAVIPKKKVIPEELASSPEPSTTTQVTQMQQVINQVTVDVKQADLEEILLPPPQVDMNVEF